MLNHFDQQVFYSIFSTDLAKSIVDTPSLLNLLLYGWTGKYALAILCVISGFIITFSVDDKTTTPPSFIVKRYFRLMIPCMLVTIILAAIAFISHQQISIRSVIASCFWPGIDSINPHFWCIDEFLIGSLIISLIVPALYKHSVNTKLLIMLIISCLLILVGQLWVGACIIGSACYYAYKMNESKQIINNIIRVLMIAMIWWLKRDVYEDISDITYIRNIIGAFLLILMISTTPILRNFLTRISPRISKYSYSLFLCHYITFVPASYLLSKLSSNSVNMWLCYVVVLVTKTALDIIIAIPLFYTGEKYLYKKCIYFISQNTGLV